MADFRHAASQFIDTGEGICLLVGRTASAEDKGQAYERLCQADFSTFAAELATIYGAVVAEQRKGLKPVSGIGPMTAQPWSEGRLSEEDRIIYTAMEAGRDAFFQGTADNARKWWRAHRAEY